VDLKRAGCSTFRVVCALPVVSARFAVTPCVTFSFEKECGSEESRLLNVSGSVCCTRHQKTHWKCVVCGDTMCYIQEVETFSFETECGSEESRLLNVSDSVCSTRRQNTLEVRGLR
jgi:hypothetical protein